MVVEDDVVPLASWVGVAAGDEAGADAEAVDLGNVWADGTSAEWDGEGETPVDGDGDAEPLVGRVGEGDSASTLMKIGLA